MFIPSSTGRDVSVQLVNNLRNLPALIDVYIRLVDEVMRKHGFNEETGEFIWEPALASMGLSDENTVEGSDGMWRELCRVDFPGSIPKRRCTNERELVRACYEDENLLVAAS